MERAVRAAASDKSVLFRSSFEGKGRRKRRATAINRSFYGIDDEVIDRDTDGENRCIDGKRKIWMEDYFECNNAEALDVLLKIGKSFGVDYLVRQAREIDVDDVQWSVGGKTYAMVQAERGNLKTLRRILEHDLKEEEETIYENGDESNRLPRRRGSMMLRARDDNGSFVQHYAVYGESITCVEMLAREFECDMCAVDELDRSTPLILSVFTANVELIESVFEHSPIESLYMRDRGNATVAGHLAQIAYGNERIKRLLAKIIARAGPGGCGQMKRGMKNYLALRKEFDGQLQVLTNEDLVLIINEWRLSNKLRSTEDLMNKQTLIQILLSATP